jgi:hypothetical protein
MASGLGHSPAISTTPSEHVLERIRAEYLEMPGMRLRLEQVQRLCGIERSMCKVALDSLVVAVHLMKNARDRFDPYGATVL